MNTRGIFLLVIFLISNLAFAKQSPSNSTNLSSEITKIFSSCKKTESDFDQRLKNLEVTSEKWAEKLTDKEIKKHLYELTFEGQLLTVISPNIISQKITTAELAKSCWVEYEDWRRTYAKTKNAQQEESDYRTWQNCIKGIYKEKLDVMALIDSCHPDAAKANVK